MFELNAQLHLRHDIFTNPQKKGIRDGFGEGILQAGKEDDRIVALCGDLTESTRVESFFKAYPTRYFEMGISEQNMMGVAAGLALNGKVPFAVSYAEFNPGRNWEQLRVSVCYSNANVKVVGSHAGVSVGPDGATHQILEDIALTRVLPNLKVFVPTDYAEAMKMTLMAARIIGPVYIRFPRSDSVMLTTEDTPLLEGKGLLYKEGTDVTLASVGSLTYETLLAAHTLHGKGVDAEVLVFPFVKPFDAHLLIKSVRKTKRVVTIEEHQVAGGFGSLVCETLASLYPVLVKRVGMMDHFGESGAVDDLYRKYKMDTAAILTAVETIIQS